jgi:membrane protein implicated in regulation of membrane protease activity
LLGFFGLGRAPLTIVIGSLMIGWGFFGLAVTEFLHRTLHLPALLSLGPSLGAAAVGSLMMAKLFGELAARLMPSDESTAISREGLLGLTGKVVFPVSESRGRIHVYDAFRTLHVEPSRVRPGEPAIASGTEVIIASIDPEQGYLIVEPLGFSRSDTGRSESVARLASELNVQTGNDSEPSARS